MVLLSSNITKNENTILVMDLNSGAFRHVFKKQSRAGTQFCAKSPQDVTRIICAGVISSFNFPPFFSLMLLI